MKAPTTVKPTVAAKPATTSAKPAIAPPTRISIPSMPGIPGITFTLPTPGSKTPPPPPVITPAIPVTQKGTSVGPQVPVLTMPPGGVTSTDQGYAPPTTPISTPTDGGGDGTVISAAPPAAAPAGGINWMIVGLAAAGVGALFFATR